MFYYEYVPEGQFYAEPKESDEKSITAKDDEKVPEKEVETENPAFKSDEVIDEHDF